MRDVVIHSRFLEKPLLWGADPRMIIDVYTIDLKAIESTFASVGAYLKASLNFSLSAARSQACRIWYTFFYASLEASHGPCRFSDRSLP